MHACRYHACRLAGSPSAVSVAGFSASPHCTLTTCDTPTQRQPHGDWTPAPNPEVWHYVQISAQRAGELETAVAAAAEASPADSLVVSPRTAAAVRNPATLASQVLRLTH